MPLTAEQIEKSRAEFQVWWDAVYLDSFKGMPVVMMQSFREIALAAWIARQETLCVELPDEYGYDGGKLDLDEVREAIEAAGIVHK